MDGLIEDRDSDSDFDPENQKNKPNKASGQEQIWDDEENCIGSAAEEVDDRKGFHSGSDADNESSEEEQDEVHSLEDENNCIDQILSNCSDFQAAQDIHAMKKEASSASSQIVARHKKTAKVKASVDDAK